MDCSPVFASIFSGISFKNQVQFNKALHTFELETGTRYLKTSRQPHREGTVEKTLFDFKHAQFACAKYGAGIRRGSRKQSPTGCTARFSASSTGGSLRVLKFDMLHNHPPEAITEDFKLSLTGDESFCDETLNAVAANIDDEPVVADLTNEFLEMFAEKSFDCFQDLLYLMNTFMKTTGSNYVMRNTVRFPKDYPNASKLIYKSIAFECYHFGTYTSYATIRRKQRTVKIGCRSKIYFCCKGDRLQVGSYQTKHNHEVSPGNGAGELRFPIGKNRRKDPLRLDYKRAIEGFPLDQYEDNFEVVVTTDNGDLRPPSRNSSHDNHWVDTSRTDPYPSLSEVGITSSRRVNRIPTAVLFSQLDFSLENLKSLASSGGASRLFSCMRDLSFLENKWRREFDEGQSCDIGVPFETSDVCTHGVGDSASRRRITTYPLSRRTNTHGVPLFGISQPPDLEQSEAEYARQPWFYN